MDFIIDLLYFKIKSESKYDKNMDVKITACKSRIKNCTLAKKKIVGQLAAKIISRALEPLQLHLEPGAGDVENGLTEDVVNKIKLLAMTKGVLA